MPPGPSGQVRRRRRDQPPGTSRRAAKYPDVEPPTSTVDLRPAWRRFVQQYQIPAIQARRRPKGNADLTASPKAWQQLVKDNGLMLFPDWSSDRCPVPRPELPEAPIASARAAGGGQGLQSDWTGSDKRITKNVTTLPAPRSNGARASGPTRAGNPHDAAWRGRAGEPRRVGVPVPAAGCSPSSSSRSRRSCTTVLAFFFNWDGITPAPGRARQLPTPGSTRAPRASGTRSMLVALLRPRADRDRPLPAALIAHTRVRGLTVLPRRAVPAAGDRDGRGGPGLRLVYDPTARSTRRCAGSGSTAARGWLGDFPGRCRRRAGRHLDHLRPRA